MMKSSNVIDSTHLANEHIIIGDVLLHSNSELIPIRIIIETPPIVSTERDFQDESIPRILASRSSQRTIVQKMGENTVKPSTKMLDQYSLVLKSMATKRIGQMHRTHDAMIAKFKSKMAIIVAVRRNFSHDQPKSQVTFF